MAAFYAARAVVEWEQWKADPSFSGLTLLRSYAAAAVEHAILGARLGAS
jgi:hypothetical protein